MGCWGYQTKNTTDEWDNRGLSGLGSLSVSHCKPASYVAYFELLLSHTPLDRVGIAFRLMSLHVHALHFLRKVKSVTLLQTSERKLWRVEGQPLLTGN